MKMPLKDISLENNEQLTPLRFFWKAIKDHPVKTSFIFLGDMVQAVCVLLLPFIIRSLIDAADGYNPKMHGSIWDAIHTPFLYLIIINIVWIIAARTSGTSLAFLAPVIRLLPRKRMSSYLNQHPINFFQTSQSGALGTKINTASVSLGHGLWVMAFDIWPVIIQFVASCILIFIADLIMGWILLIWSVVYFIVSVNLAIRRGYWSERISHERAFITGAIVDVATNIQAVKSYANEDFEEKNLDRKSTGEVRSIIKFNILREIGGWFHSLMAFGLLIGLMVISLEYYQTGMFSIGDIAFVFSLILILVQQAGKLTYTVSNFLELFGQMADGVNTLFKPVALKDKPKATPINVKRGRIFIKDMKFGYEDTNNEIVFDAFNLEIKPGEKIGLIGKSGSGKTSLVNLIMRFYDVQGGKIEIDGQNIAYVTQKSLRQNIAVIPQDTSLFHRTLLENIRYGDLSASDEDVITASKKAHAHEFISRLPNGYNTLVGERGVRLSGGQRQRIAIARAILKDAPILILDEATSALDSESEKLIQDSLKELMDGKTVIAIAHRLSTINHLDRLVVLNEGKIVEQGSHRDLMQKKGLYAKLWEMQSGGFIGE